MGMQFEGRIGTGQEALDSDLRDIRIWQWGEVTYLYAATGQNGGLSVYRLSDDGQLATLADTLYHGATGIGLGPTQVIGMDGNPRLVLGGIGGGRMISFHLEEDGGFGRSSQMDFPGDGTTPHAVMAEALLPGGTSALYMVDAVTGRLSGVLTNGRGGFQGQLPVSSRDGEGVLRGEVTLATTQVAGNGFLLAADTGAQGVTSYAIAATGALRATGRLGAADGLGISTPTAMEVVSAHGATWVILGAAGSGSISVMRLGADGALTPTDHLLDTLDTRFADLQALSVVRAGAHVFVLAGGSDDGLSLFSLLPGGQLVYLETLADAAGLGLNNVTGIEAVLAGDRIQVFVSSEGAGGLSQFAIPLEGLGDVISGAGAAATRRTGTGGDDVIKAGAGRDTLVGQAGDDILVSGAAGAVLTGGAGADMFVLCPGTGSQVITDFEPGIDRLDLSHFPMLGSPDQLQLTQTRTGLRLEFGEDEIVINSRSGGALNASDLWTGGLGTPSRMLVLASPSGEERQGSDGDDEIRTGDGDDRIWAGEGADRVYGGAGIDQIWGGGGEDRLYGGEDDDVLRGEAGADRLIGGGGADQIWGGGGADRLAGNSGDDSLRGGGGDDVLRGGSGRDRLYGQGGDDRLYGQAGADQLSGGKGGDMLRGGADADVLRGGGGRDRLLGQGGTDRLSGDGGNDRLSGGNGADVFIFRARHGQDTITDFRPGQDRIWIDIDGADFAGLRIRGTGRGEDRASIIETGAGTITLEGIRVGQLDADDFLFA